MDQSQFIENLKEALEMEDQEISASESFRDLEEWDSFSQLSVIAMLDEKYDVKIENEDMEKLETVEDLCKEVEKRQNT